MKVKTKVWILQFVKQFQYSFILGICTLVLLLQVYLCMVKYVSVPTYISSYITDQNKADFPEITFCKNEESYKHSILKQSGISDEEHYSGTENHTWVSRNSSVTPQALFTAATYSATELIDSFYIRTITADSGGHFGFLAPLNRSDQNFIIWRENQHRGFGRCHSAYPGLKLKQLMLYYTKISLKESVKMYFHHEGQFLDLNGRMGIKALLGTKIQMQITWAHVKMLDQSVKSQASGYKCNGSVAYDKCMYTAVTKAMTSATTNSCTVPWVPGNLSICTSDYDRNASFWAHYNRITNQQGDCPNPCTFLSVTAGGQNREDLPDNQSQVYLYFQSKTQINKESLLYTTLSLFAEIGGYVGLLLGVAIFHLADLINMFLDTKISGYIKRMEEHDEEQSSKVYKVMRNDSEQFC